MMSSTSKSRSKSSVGPGECAGFQPDDGPNSVGTRGPVGPPRTLPLFGKCRAARQFELQRVSAPELAWGGFVAILFHASDHHLLVVVTSRA